MMVKTHIHNIQWYQRPLTLFVNYNKPRKSTNIMDYKAIELKMLHSMPLFDIELSRSCNANCCFCPRKKLSDQNPIMDNETITEVIKWIPKNSSVILAGLGEPLLNDNIFDAIEKLRKKDIAVSLISNGILLTDDVMDRLYESGLNEIQISLHTLDADLHKKVTGTDKFSTIVENI